MIKECKKFIIFQDSWAVNPVNPKRIENFSNGCQQIGLLWFVNNQDKSLCVPGKSRWKSCFQQVNKTGCLSITSMTRNIEYKPLCPALLKKKQGNHVPIKNLPVFPTFSFKLLQLCGSLIQLSQKIDKVNLSSSKIELSFPWHISQFIQHS